MLAACHTVNKSSTRHFYKEGWLAKLSLNQKQQIKMLFGKQQPTTTYQIYTELWDALSLATGLIMQPKQLTVINCK